MWQVYEHRRVARQISRLPMEILKRYEKWKDIVTISGPRGFRLIRGYDDGALAGEWAGHRSSRLVQEYRVIYRIEKDAVRVEAVNLAAHECNAAGEKRNYRKAKRTVRVSAGRSVRIIRELQGMSQNDLAAASGIPQSTISAIECDRINLGVERAKQLARALKCHPAVLVFPGWDVERESAA